MGTSELNQLPAGTKIGGRYKIIEVIGQGGFGITYRGYDLTLDVPVAVKEYYPTGIASRYHTQSLDVQVGGAESKKQFEEGKEKFLEEARALARFSEDPNVVGVRDFFEDNQTVYIVMQYLEGESLKDYTAKNGKLSFDEAFELLRPVMHSLGRMHESGLIHRDISPSNLIRMCSGRIKLIDFGTAREISAEGEKSLSVMLKPGYAPSEQYKTRGAQGSWTDVYALCASIYKLITGITPDNSLNRILEDELRPPSQCGAAIRPAQEKVLMQGLAVRAGDRIQTMRALEQSFDDAFRVTDISKKADPEVYDDERTVMGPSTTDLQEKNVAHPVPEAKPAEDARTREKPTKKEPQKSRRQAEKEAGSRQKEKEAGSRQAEKEAGSRQAEQKAGRRQKEKRGGRRENEAGRRRRILPVLAGILVAAAAVVAFLYLRSNGTGGGEIADWTNGTKIVRFGTYGDGTEVTGSDLAKIDRNKDVAALKFNNCILSDETISRLGSMKHIHEIELDGCSGYTSLTPLSGLQSLEALKITPAIGDQDPVFDGSSMFGEDIPQLKEFTLFRFRLKNGFDFLKHFSGLTSLYLSNLALDEAAAALPENLALVYLTINDTDLSQTDLSVLGREPNLKNVTLNNAGITDLSCLEAAGALETISAVDNQLTSLDGLQNKEALRYVTLDRNQIADISALHTCPELNSFSAVDNQISDISAVSACSGLNKIELDRNQIADISALAACTELFTLSMEDNQITDASALSGCPELGWLNLSGNSLTDLSCLSDSDNMRSLYFSRNQISDLLFCQNMLILEHLRASDNQIQRLDGLENVTQLEEVRLDHNQITDISLLAKNTDKLKTAVLDANQIADISPLASCAGLEGLSLNDNQLTELAALKSCPNLYFLSASGNEISDISGLESCTALYMADLGENRITDVSALGNSGAQKMALLLQNNQIRDISPLYGMKDYVFLSLYNNELKDISGLSSMTGIGGSSIIYLGWWDGLEAEELSETTYREPRLVDVPADRQVNMLNTFRDARKEAGSPTGSIEYLTGEEADAEIADIRTEARVKAGIEDNEET